LANPKAAGHGLSAPLEILRCMVDAGGEEEYTPC
jgi:hypothetical protein